MSVRTWGFNSPLAHSRSPHLRAPGRVIHRGTVAGRYAVPGQDRETEEIPAYCKMLSEGMPLLAIDVPPERYVVVIPQAIAVVHAELGDGP